ncbi:MAG: preprotein translocase subunit SecD [Christensenellales bacterium]|jgi:preprotein translocase subunit SecD
MNKKSLIWLVVIIAAILAIGYVAVFGIEIGLYDIGVAQNIQLGGDLSEGMQAYYVAYGDAAESITEDELRTAASVYEKRLHLAGYRHATVSLYGDKGVLLDMPGVTETNAYSLLPYATARGRLTIEDEDGNEIAELTNIKRARAGATSMTAQNSNYGVIIDFAGESTDKIKEISKTHKDKTLSVKLDGTDIDTLVFASENTTGGLTLDNGYSSGAAYQYALQLSAGYSPIVLTMNSFNTVQASAGDTALKDTLTAMLIGLLAVMVAFLICFRLSGLAAAIALSLQALIMMFCFATIRGFELTMAGMLGLILSFMVATGLYITVLRGVSREMADGKSIAASIESAYSKLTKTLIDMSILFIIAAGAMFFAGTGHIKDFGAVAGIGAICSLALSSLALKQLLRLTGSIDTKPSLFIRH